MAGKQTGPMSLVASGMEIPNIGQPQLPPPVIVEYRDQNTKELQGRIAFPQVYVTFISDDALAKIAAHTTHTILAELERRGIIPPPGMMVAPADLPAEPEPVAQSVETGVESETPPAEPPESPAPTEE